MWKLWKKSESSEGPDHGAALEQIESRLAALEGEITTIRAEWTKTTLSIRRVMAHITKAAAVDRKPEAADPEDLELMRDRLLTQSRFPKSPQ